MKACIYFLLFFISTSLVAQNSFSSIDSSSFQNKTIVSLNTTSLLMQLVPFNRSNPTLVGPYSVSFARYKENNQAFTFALGVNLHEFDDEDELFLNVKIGWEKRKVLYERWYYTKAWDIFLSGGSLNTPGVEPTNSLTIGTGPTWGIGYQINPMIGLHIETSLLMGLNFDFGIIDFQFIPPVALYLHVAVPRTKRQKRS